MIALPAIHSLRVACPESQLVGMARPEHVELAQRIGALDEVLPAPPSAGVDRYRATLSVPGSLRHANLDAAVLLAPSFEAALTVWLAGIPLRVGHGTDRRAALLNRVVEVQDCHRSDGFQDLVSELGAKPIERVDDLGLLQVEASDRAYIDRLLTTLGPPGLASPIFINPASGKKPRAWASDRFCQLAKHLAERYPAMSVLVHDHHPFDPPAGWPSSDSIRTVSGASLVELAAVIERCSLYVGNDSGPMHIAAALGVPTVGIYGSSSPDRTSPHGVWRAVHLSVSASFACSPCRERFFEDCPSLPSSDERPPCLNEVSVKMVAAEVDRILESRS
jgi:heptosyltransferase-2